MRHLQFSLKFFPFAAIVLFLGACCQDPPANRITYTGLDIKPDQIETPKAAYISFSIPISTEWRVEEGKRKVAACYHKVEVQEYVNPFDTARYSLMLNRPLRIAGFTLPAYSNLLHESFNSLNISKAFNALNNYPELLVLYADTQFVKWPIGPVKVIFSGGTVRGDYFTDSADIFIR